MKFYVQREDGRYYRWRDDDRVPRWVESRSEATWWRLESSAIEIVHACWDFTATVVHSDPLAELLEQQEWV